ncbi:hypothetical protein L2E82_06023 [Cichorium intybus]|uniref:Uncharacterized protein n=1 Tax=Cichorium intybus TaxID=13427 RepID=A0ACB9HA06_CICIN|nr:hypothetical protein L2E82_06023 [Cichorium intybus]
MNKNRVLKFTEEQIHFESRELDFTVGSLSLFYNPLKFLGNDKLDEGIAARQEANDHTIEVGDDRLQEVDVVQTAKGHATAKDLIESGYRMTEVVNALLETPLPLTVEQLSQCDEEVDVVAETQQEEFIEETQPSKEKLKSRKKSERILKAKLSQIKGGRGSTSGDPYTLE